ncbi:MAG: DUF3482 domain-containing protein [Phycisphaeraceae bacterium]|nr:DUF3482 domain-containing protein [Phycisphaeraceae bacterium]
MAEPLLIGVVGQVNAGKSSVHESLLRYRDPQAVSAEPGWTREVRAMDLRVSADGDNRIGQGHGRGEVAARLLDFPGFQRIEALERMVDRTLPKVGAAADTNAEPTARPSEADMERLLQEMRKEGDFRHEELVTEGARRCQVLLLVVDTREAPSSAFESERRLLTRLTGLKPIILLNCTAHQASRVAAWQEALRADTEPALPFDAWHLAWAHELALWRRVLARVAASPAHAAIARAILHDRERHRAEADEAVALQIADLLIDVAAARRPVEHADDRRERLEAARELMERARRREQLCFEATLSRLGFRKGDAVLEALGAGDDAALSDPWSAREIARRMPGLVKGLAAGAAVGTGVGAATGFVVDLATMFTTIGAATALGAKLGAAAGAVAGGAWAIRDKLVELPQLGTKDARLSREAIELLALRQVEMSLGLFGRGHAALDVAPVRAAAGIALGADQRSAVIDIVGGLVQHARPARWSTLNGPVALDASDRVRAVRDTQRRLVAVLGSADGIDESEPPAAP